MSDLNKIRKEIDSIDSELLALLQKRFACSIEVAKAKFPKNDAIYAPAREENILSRIEHDFKESELSFALKSFYRSLMRLSRESQYLYFVQNKILPDFFDSIEWCDTLSNHNAVYFGKEGSWSYLAASRIVPPQHLTPADHFEAVFEAVSKQQYDVGVVPIYNSTAGMVSKVYDLLPQYGVFIVGSCETDIKYSLCCHPDSSLEQISCVRSHPQALDQCANFLKSRHLTPIADNDTASAAKYVANGTDSLDTAALCNAYAAQKHGLKVLFENVRDADQNTTKFIYISKNKRFVESAKTISLIFHLPHKSNALSSVLALFADHNINLLRLTSRPIPDRPFEFSFFLDFAGNLKDPVVQSILAALQNEIPLLSVLGNY